VRHTTAGALQPGVADSVSDRSARRYPLRTVSLAPAGGRGSRSHTGRCRPAAKNRSGPVETGDLRRDTARPLVAFRPRNHLVARWLTAGTGVIRGNHKTHAGSYTTFRPWRHVINLNRLGAGDQVRILRFHGRPSPHRPPGISTRPRGRFHAAARNVSCNHSAARPAICKRDHRPAGCCHVRITDRETCKPRVPIKRRTGFRGFRIGSHPPGPRLQQPRRFSCPTTLARADWKH